MLFQNFSGQDGHLFFKGLIDIQNKFVNVELIRQTNERYMSVEYGCVKFLDSMRFLTYSLDTLAKTLLDNEFIYHKKEFGSSWRLFTEKMAYPYEYFKDDEDYEKPIEELLNLGKEGYYNTLHITKYSDQAEIDRTKNIINVFNIRNGRELTELYCKSDDILLKNIFEIFFDKSKKQFGINKPPVSFFAA